MKYKKKGKKNRANKGKKIINEMCGNFKTKNITIKKKRGNRCLCRKIRP